MIKAGFAPLAGYGCRACVRTIVWFHGPATFQGGLQGALAAAQVVPDLWVVRWDPMVRWTTGTIDQGDACGGRRGIDSISTLGFVLAASGGCHGRFDVWERDVLGCVVPRIPVGPFPCSLSVSIHRDPFHRS